MSADSTAVHAPADRLAAALADRYRIERELGQGGMATVYLAQDVKHDRRVALKVLRPELAAVIGGDRFLGEIKTTANLQHPHILPLHDSGTVDGTVFYVMPYVEGESLRDRLHREKQLAVDEAVRLVREVAGALDYAHRHGIIHRDIKPENILLHDGQALIADFGIALAVSRSEGGARLTETGLSLGTPHYMSPEQAMGERTLDARTDVYALGCVLYELLTGEPPFTGPTAQAIVAKVLAGDPKPVTVLRRTVPAHVAAAVHTALQKLPADRFTSAAELGAALANREFATTVALPGARPIAGFRRNRPAQLLGFLALLGLGAAAWGWLRPAPLEPVSRYSIRLAEGQELADELGVGRIALSPDGRLLAYLGRGPQSSRLYLRPADDLTARPIPGTDAAINPAFSPDGRKLAFVSGSPRAIRVVSLSGGPSTTITDSLVDRGGMAWGRDGFIYFDGHLAGDGVARVRETGGSPEPVSMPDTARAESWHFQPEPLPNGKGVVFTVSYGGLLGRMQLAVVDLSTGRHRLLVPGMSPRYSRTGHLVYATAEGLLMAVPFDQDRMELTGDPMALVDGVSVRGLGRADIAVSASGSLVYTRGDVLATTGELVWATRSGEVTPVDPQWSGEFSRIELSPDGSKVAVAMRTDDGTQVWIKELDRGPASRLTFQGDRNMSPSWSPDGRRVVFASNAEGHASLYTAPADGSALPELFHRGRSGSITSGFFTRRGDFVVYQMEGNLYGLRTTGDTGTVPLADGPSIEAYGAVSPDGRWLAYASDESGAFQVYVRPFPDVGRSKRQVSTRGGVMPFWSRDGRELFYMSLSRELIAAGVAPGPAFGISSQKSLFSLEGFGVAGPNRFLDVSPDGRRFLLVRPLLRTSNIEELVVVEGFFSMLASSRR